MDKHKTNTGNEELSSVQVIDAITVAPSNFPAGSTATITGTTGGLTAATSPEFDGFTTTAMLSGTDTLAVSANGTVSMAVTFTPDLQMETNLI